MRKKQRRLGFEVLESMTLLSGLVASPQPIHLTGSVKLTLDFHGRYLGGKVSGSVKPMGHVTDSGGAMSLINSFTFGRDSGSLTLASKAGKVSIAMGEATMAAHGYEVKYTVTGGTGAYAGETGSGVIYQPYPFHGKFLFK